MAAGEFRTKPDRCLNCGHLIDGALAVGHENGPRPGDVTICIDCGHIMAFGGNLRMRSLTDEEMIAVAGDRRIVMTQRAIAETRKWKG